MGPKDKSDEEAFKHHMVEQNAANQADNAGKK